MTMGVSSRVCFCSFTTYGRIAFRSTIRDLIQPQEPSFDKH